MSALRLWLIDESPSSRLQASVGRAWRLAGLLCRNPLALLGAIIILLLILVAVFAPVIAPETPVGQNLSFSVTWISFRTD